MPRLARAVRALATVALLAGGATPAAAQLDAGFDSATPFAGWTNAAFGGPATRVTSVGSLVPLSATFFAMLRANEAGPSPSNYLTDGLDNWAYAPLAGAGLPGTTATASVLLSPSFSLAAPGTVRFAVNFLANPFALGSAALGNEQNRDYATVRLLPAAGAASVLYAAQVQEDGSALVSGSGVAGGSYAGVATGDAGYARSYGWTEVAAALDAGTYQLEFTAANEYDKQFDAALGIDAEALSASSTVPEPGTLVLLASGLAAGGVAMRRRRTRAR